MRRNFTKGFALPILVSMLSVVMLCLLPLTVHAEGSNTLMAAQRSEAEIDAMVEPLLQAGDYVEGEAIVCFLPSDGLTAQADSLLNQAENLSEVSARQYAEATGEVVPVADEAGALTAQAEEAPVQIVLVRSDIMTTAELLRKLLCDPQVLSAEPNYLMGFAEDEPAEDVFAEEPADQLQVDAEENEPQIEESQIEESQIEEPQSEEPVEGVIAEPLVSQSDPVGSASQDLTNYQWFSVGVEGALPQYLDGKNPGINAPDWNVPGKTNAEGVVAILDSGVDYNHSDLAAVMYHFTPEQQTSLGCGEFGYAPAREDKADPMDGYDHGTHCAGIVAA
ncbi:MAG: S8 family serine peptidase [Atopobiaceae bacterium]|nr:S8 family serine peptidase [Atopobiaceae bacterium]